MLITKEIGNSVAKVYVGQTTQGKIEFAQSLQPPLQIAEKWVLTLSCLYGCPVHCLMCDAGQHYNGLLTKEEILEQIDHLVLPKFPNRVIPVKKFKIQFARMGEPAYNPAVLEVLQELPTRYDAPGLLASLSTIGPQRESFFNELLHVSKLYNGRFQLQFSIHTTDETKRNKLIPVKKMNFSEIADYGKKFYRGGRKITLNFIVMKSYPINPHIIKKFFDPSTFVIKLTPLNPTKRAATNSLKNKLTTQDTVSQLVTQFTQLGYTTFVSIGEPQENTIGSNCGQYIS
jgi:23S rRNA (adenine2503-C2)-methyltransferase